MRKRARQPLKWHSVKVRNMTRKTLSNDTSAESKCEYGKKPPKVDKKSIAILNWVWDQEYA